MLSHVRRAVARPPAKREFYRVRRFTPGGKFVKEIYGATATAAEATGRPRIRGRFVQRGDARIIESNVRRLRSGRGGVA